MQPKKDYVIAVQAPAYPLGDGRFVTESAFAVHLKELQQGLAETFGRLIVIAPVVSKEAYEKGRGTWGEISEQSDGIALVPAFEITATPWKFWTRDAWPLWTRIRKPISEAGFVHSGLASDTWRPFLAFVNLRAWLERTPTQFFVDIDFRKLSQRLYQTGMWSRKSYLINRSLHDQFKHLQVWLAVRTCNLVFLKSPSMVADYGAGRAHVRDFLDAAHSATAVVTDSELETRLAARREPGRPLEVIYFGRFVPYKGLDYVLQAVRLALARGGKIHLTLLGSGECLDALRETSLQPALHDAVTFLPPVPYGPELFELIDRADVAVAAPKAEDTPRAALDAMARGLPIVAFDIDYFKNLSEKSGAVALAAWPSPEYLAEQMINLSENRLVLDEMARKAVHFARNNTQEIWLRRRIDWTTEAYSAMAASQQADLSQKAKRSSVLG